MACNVLQWWNFFTVIWRSEEVGNRWSDWIGIINGKERKRIRWVFAILLILEDSANWEGDEKEGFVWVRVLQVIGSREMMAGKAASCP